MSCYDEQAETEELRRLLGSEHEAVAALQAQLEAVGLRLREAEGHHRRDHEALAAAESRAKQLSGELRDGKGCLDDALSASSRLQVRESARGW